MVDVVRRVCTRAATPDDLLESVSREVARTVPFDASMWFGVDPATLLATAPARIEGMDSGYCHSFWHGEFHHHDAALFRDLASGPVPAATLRGTTDDRPVRSPRYRDFMRPQGWDDELRVVFRTGGRAWAMAGLYRERGRPPFDADDVALMAALSPVVAGAVRARAALAPAAPALSAAPGLMVFTAEGVVVSANAEATRWLSEIHGPGGEPRGWIDVLRDPVVDDLRAAVPLIPLLQRARAVAAGREEGQARLRLRDRSGRWLVLHASCLEGGAAAGSIAVVVEPAKSAEVAPIVIEAYGLSPRERDVVREIAGGSSTPEIAARLFLSAHTVRDYVKSVFDKVGVGSRAELVAKLFAEHYADPFHDAMVHVD